MGTLAVETNNDGYRQLLSWAQKFGVLRRAGVEGTGSYGAALTHALQSSGVTVIEINRPDRSRRRGRGKSDATDAQSAARAVLAGDATSIPKAHNGLAEGLRTLNLVRRSAVKAKTQAINQIRALLVSAPQTVRDAVYKTEASKCVAACAVLPKDSALTAVASLQTALRLLAKRWTALYEELHELDAQLARLTKKADPRLLACFGVGPQTAATLLVTAGDNPTRLHSEAALAARCGISPLQASSGKTQRHRLNRVVEIARPTTRCGPLQWFACEVTRAPGITWPSEQVKGYQRKKSTGA